MISPIGLVGEICGVTPFGSGGICGRRLMTHQSVAAARSKTTTDSPAFNPFTTSTMPDWIRPSLTWRMPSFFALGSATPEMRGGTLIDHGARRDRRGIGILAGDDAGVGEHLRLQLAVRVLHLGPHRQAMRIGIDRGGHVRQLCLNTRPG
jgi:hypothetical protein